MDAILLLVIFAIAGYVFRYLGRRAVSSVVRGPRRRRQPRPTSPERFLLARLNWYTTRMTHRRG
jgi:hypothetical protein